MADSLHNMTVWAMNAQFSKNKNYGLKLLVLILTMRATAGRIMKRTMLKYFNYSSSLFRNGYYRRVGVSNSYLKNVKKIIFSCIGVINVAIVAL